jgi:hypothetical protein
MKAWKFSALFAMSVLLATSAFAAANKTSIDVRNDLMVSGKTLPAGKYTVTWEGQGQNVDLIVAKGKEVLVKTPAHLVNLSTPAANNAVVSKNNPDGTSALSQIQISGKKFALEIGEPNGQTDVASRMK